LDVLEGHLHKAFAIAVAVELAAGLPALMLSKRIELVNTAVAAVRADIEIRTEKKVQLT
jgi:hypothetical protein